MKPSQLSNRALILISLGTFIEWAEYIYYGYLAHFLSKLFFPPQDSQLALFITFAIMAGGYTMRPIGALIFGYIGDKKGRNSALFASMALMAISTITIGLLPSYSEVGVLAPIGLLIARLIQGVAIGGEFNGACVYLIETHPNRPHFYSSIAMLGSVIGMVVGALCAGLVQSPNMPEWAYKVPFLLGGTLAFVGMFLRAKQPNLRPIHEAPALQIFKRYKKSLMKVMVAGASTAFFVYIGNVYYVTYLVDVAQIDRSTASYMAMFGEAIVIIGLPLSALYCDKYSSLAFFRAALSSVILFSPFIFSLSQPADTLFYYFIAQFIFGVLDSIYSAPIMKWVFDEFPEEIRYTGVSLGWGLGVACLGGFAPLLAAFMQKNIHAIYGPSLLIQALALLLLFSTFITGSNKALRS